MLDHLEREGGRGGREREGGGREWRGWERGREGRREKEVVNSEVVLSVLVTKCDI